MDMRTCSTQDFARVVSGIVEANSEVWTASEVHKMIVEREQPIRGMVDRVLIVWDDDGEAHIRLYDGIEAEKMYSDYNAIGAKVLIARIECASFNVERSGY